MSANIKEIETQKELKVVKFETAFRAQSQGKQVFDEGLFGEVYQIEIRKISTKENREVFKQAHNYVMRYLLEDNSYSKWECAPIGNMFLLEK